MELTNLHPELPRKLALPVKFKTRVTSSVVKVGAERLYSIVTIGLL